MDSFEPGARARPRRRILLPIDGAPLSEPVLGAVGWIASRQASEVAFLALPGPDGSALEGQLETLRARFASEGVPVHETSRAGDPAEAILSLAGELEPSFIALASPARTGLDRWRKGCVAETVLRRSRCPVLTHRSLGAAPASRPADRSPTQSGDGTDEPDPGPFRNVLVPLDGTSRAATVLPFVIELARLGGSRVTLLHSHEHSVQPEVPSGLEGVLATTPTRDDALLAPFRAALAERGIRVRTRVAVGHAADAILETARREGADLIALTTHGRRGLARLVFGSVAEDVVRGSVCPVLVQRATSAGAAFAPVESAAGSRGL